MINLSFLQSPPVHLTQCVHSNLLFLVLIYYLFTYMQGGFTLLAIIPYLLSRACSIFVHGYKLFLSVWCTNDKWAVSGLVLVQLNQACKQSRACCSRLIKQRLSHFLPLWSTLQALLDFSFLQCLRPLHWPHLSTSPSKLIMVMLYKLYSCFLQDRVRH